MAEKLLKKKAHKVSPKKKPEEQAKKTVLVGTYKGDQLEKWPGYYNYPISSKDKIDVESAKKVNELWLFQGAKAGRYFTAEYVGTFTRDELKTQFGYPAKGKPHGDKYLLYKITKTDIYDPATGLVEAVIVRAKDFKTASRTGRQIKAYLESPERKDPITANLVPKILTELPREILRVCEAAVQMEFGLEFDAMQQSEISIGSSVVGSATIEFGDSLVLCETWPRPTVIVSDGPYGLGSYPGDPETPDDLEEFYKPFLEKWYDSALPSATLWFWNSEQGWATCHRMIESCGWEFRNCHVWNKGLSHVAGNCNTKTIRKYPVVTEVCVQYVRKNYLKSGGRELPLREWMREEWRRTGLPFRMTNTACGVKDAATRKYFTTDHLWYFPPADAFVKIAAFANLHGNINGRPFFAKASGGQFLPAEWNLMRAKFHCEVGVSNVWNHPAVRGQERIKNGMAALHMNQKPLMLLERIIASSSDEGDVVWEPFGGLCSASLAALRMNRHAYASEINPVFYNASKERMKHERR